MDDLAPSPVAPAIARALLTGAEYRFRVRALAARETIRVGDGTAFRLSGTQESHSANFDTPEPGRRHRQVRTGAARGAARIRLRRRNTERSPAICRVGLAQGRRQEPPMNYVPMARYVNTISADSGQPCRAHGLWGYGAADRDIADNHGPSIRDYRSSPGKDVDGFAVIR